jgi:hypothetical protein
MSRRHAINRRSGLIAVILLALMGTGLEVASAGPLTPELTASAPGELTEGGALSVTGRLVASGQGPSGVPLVLQSDPYPFRGFLPLAHASTAPDGSFTFADVRPDRNTRLRVIGEGSPASIGPVLEVSVNAKVEGNARSLGPGRVRLSLRVHHTILGSSAPVGVRWFLAARASRVFRLAAVTPTRELSPGVSYASVIVDPPVKRFVYRVCLNPPWEKAMGPARSHRTCPQATFVTRGNGS